LEIFTGKILIGESVVCLLLLVDDVDGDARALSIGLEFCCLTVSKIGLRAVEEDDEVEDKVFLDLVPDSVRLEVLDDDVLGKNMIVFVFLS
jgi:hypothetical protein